jgi:hypothetical protein
MSRSARLSDYAMMAMALRELLIDKKVIDDTAVPERVDILHMLPARLRFNVVGGVRAPLHRVEHEFGLWEKSFLAIAEMLDRRNIISAEERLRAIEVLQPCLKSTLSYDDRSVIAFTAILFQKALVTPSEIAQKVLLLEARVSAEPADGEIHSGTR